MRKCKFFLALLATLFCGAANAVTCWDEIRGRGCYCYANDPLDACRSATLFQLNVPWKWHDINTNDNWVIKFVGNNQISLSANGGPASYHSPRVLSGGYNMGGDINDGRIRLWLNDVFDLDFYWSAASGYQVNKWVCLVDRRIQRRYCTDQ